MTTDNDIEPRFVDTPDALNDLCERLAGSPWLGIDTEFMREKTYYPRLCLLQVSGPDVIACVDPLALEHLDPLLDLIYEPGIVKVLHSARQDYEILYHLRGTLPGPVFDTQVAAALLCHSDQIGYGNLVAQELGVRLDKGHTRTDWSLRPLSPEQLSYAADDVRWLGPLYQRQRAALEEQGRLEWLAEDFAALTDPALYAPDPDAMWRRVKDHRRLKGAQLAVLAALAAWRERRAMERDRPRRWILKDEVLLELARAMPAKPAALERIRGLDPGTAKRAGAELLAVIAEARETPKEQWPTLAPKRELAPGQDAVVDLMMALLRTLAAQHGLSPAMLGTRADLERLVLGEADVPLRHGWRRALVGAELEALLAGERRLGVSEARVTVTAAGPESPAGPGV